MRKIFSCRRTAMALVGMFLLFILGIVKGADVATSIAAITMALSASNAYEGKKDAPKNP